MISNYVINFNSRKRVTFDILNFVREYLTLLQFMYTLGNVNRAVNIAGVLMYGANLLSSASFSDIIVGSYMCILKNIHNFAAEFDQFYCAVSFISPTEKYIHLKEV